MMNTKLLRTILLASGIGFFVLWVLEFRRAGLFESYWLLLVALICILSFQFSRLKASMQAGKVDKATDVDRKVSASKRAKK
jgi:hypothetical protein